MSKTKIILYHVQSNRHYSTTLKHLSPYPNINLIRLIRGTKNILERYKLSEERITNPRKYLFLTSFIKAIIKELEKQLDKLSHCIA